MITTIQELKKLLDKADDSAEIQCLVWDGRLERDLGYEISEVRINDNVVSFELVGRV